MRMAIKKMTWTELMQTIIPSRLSASITNLTSLIGQVNTAQQTLIGSSNLSNVYNEMLILLCQNVNVDSAWKDLVIVGSDFKLNDCRYPQFLFQKAYEYAGFYKKILTDEGVQRALVYAKTYNNSGTASSTVRGANSNTPQNSMLYNATEATANELFDQAIADYATTIDRTKASSTSSSQGGSRTSVSGTTWEEGKKNLQMRFYSELVNFIATIPERIYSWYSLDTMPAPELMKNFCQYLDEVAEIFQDE